MVLRNEERIVLWPIYFDRARSRSNGRRVPKKVAVNSPTVEDIAIAAKRLRLAPLVEPEKAHPRYWWRKNGRVLVNPTTRKEVILYSVARAMKYPKAKPVIGKPRPKVRPKVKRKARPKAVAKKTAATKRKGRTRKGGKKRTKTKTSKSKVKRKKRRSKK